MTPWVNFLAGPVIWFAHFMVVYIAVEAGCAAGAGSTGVLGLSALSIFTLVATAAAASAALFFAYRAYGQGDRGGDADGGLAFAGVLLGLLFCVAILFVGLPALWLQAC